MWAPARNFHRLNKTWRLFSSLGSNPAKDASKILIIQAVAPSTAVREAPLWRTFSTSVGNNAELTTVSLNVYEKVSEETLESLSETFEELLESKYGGDADITLANGVLTIQLENDGTYVVNKQTPNRQIWLSSPTSGPKRYDYMDGKWVYRHDGKSLHELLSEEFSKILDMKVEL